MTASSALTFDSLIQIPLDVIIGAQTEIFIFVIAILAHTLLFGRRHGAKSTKMASKKVDMMQSPSSEGPVQRPLTTLIRLLEAKLREGATQVAIFDLISSRCGVLPQLRESLSDLLEGLGKSANAELLAALRDVMRKHSVRPTPRLAVTLLQGYSRLRLQREFDEFLGEVQQDVGETVRLPPCIARVALKQALRSSDIRGALKHVGALAAAEESGHASPSAAPRQLLQQLVRLAVEKNELHSLLQELTPVLSGWTLEVLLLECARMEDAAAATSVEVLAREQGVALTPAALSALVKIRGCPHAAAQLLADAAGAAPVAKEILVTVADIALAQRDTELARAVWAQLSSTTSPQVAAAMVRLASSGLLSDSNVEDTILELFEKYFTGISLQSEAKTERIIADAALSRGRSDLIRVLLGAETARQVTLLKSYGVDRRLDDAVTIFQLCADKTASHYNALLDVCGECQDSKAAEDVLAQAVAAGIADVVTYNTLIKVHLQSGKFQRARAGLDSMRAAGVMPTVVTFNELLDATVRRDADAVWQLLKEMEAFGLQPNSFTCSILMKGMTANSNRTYVERVFKVLEATGSEMDEVSLCSMIEACVRVGRLDLLRRQLEQLRRCRSKGQLKSAHAYGSIIRGCGIIQDLDGVWEAWREMRSRKFAMTSVTLGCMVEAVASNGHPEMGYEIIHEVLREEGEGRSLVNSVIYGSVLKGFSQQKKFEQVWTVYQEMLQQKVQFSIVTCNTLVDACARCNQMGRVEAILQEMSLQGVSPNIITYSAIIKGYCQESRMDKAFQLLEDMKRNTKLRPDEHTYNTLLNGCARQCLHERGVRLLGEMEEAGVAPTNYTLSVLAKLGSRGMRLQKAFDICEEISRKYRFRLNVHVYTNLLQACISHKDTGRALELLQRMVSEKVSPDARTYTLLLRGLVAAHRGQDAAAVLRAAFGLPGVGTFFTGDRKCATLYGGLPSELVVEVLEGLGNSSGVDVATLLGELRGVQGLRLPATLSMRVARR
mmetsp:Transcript_36452/g.79759  ORF Transcript_36452/g.79759 Transcript_36452/m.79759 type:complete len:1007 (-) Transcript_36452:107-3127(-)